MAVGEIGGNIALTLKQIEQVQIYAKEIIEMLPPKAVNELLEGYNQDQEALLNETFRQINNVVNFGATLESEKLDYLDGLERGMDMSLRKLSYNYFKTTCLPNFHQGWRNIEWANLVQLFPWSVYLAARGHGKSFEWCFSFSMWRLYSYDRPNYFQRDSIDNKNRKETMMITNESSLGITHLAKIIEEINHNDILKEKLNPSGKELGKTGFTTETGSLIKLRSLFSSGIRGNHVGSVVFDDLISESSLYSKEQRNKAKEIFYGAIVSVVEPHGFCVGSGTPYAHGDIYTDLKKDPKFKVFEYPAISPFYEADGKLSYRLLSPDRFTYKHLLEVKESIGSSVFSREYLTTPVTDTSSLFPYEILNKCVAGMETISFAQNIESFPFKLVKVIVGCDFALSANIGADFSVFSALGMDKDENFYLIYMWRKSGATHNEQINQIVSIDQRFRPNTIVCENNGFQSIISDLARGRGLRNIEEFTTTSGVKKNSYEGLPSIAAIMERGQLKFPYKEGETRELVETIMGEFHQVAFNEDTGKLEGVGSHDDCPMSIFMGLTKLRENTTKFRAHLL